MRPTELLLAYDDYRNAIESNSIRDKINSFPPPSSDSAIAVTLQAPSELRIGQCWTGQRWSALVIQNGQRTGGEIFFQTPAMLIVDADSHLRLASGWLTSDRI